MDPRASSFMFEPGEAKLRRLELSKASEQTVGRGPFRRDSFKRESCCLYAIRDSAGVH